MDEVHWGKNLPFATRLERVKGLPNPAECQRATDLFLKTEWLLERGGGIVFATAPRSPTPSPSIFPYVTAGSFDGHVWVIAVR